MKKFFKILLLLALFLLLCSTMAYGLFSKVPVFVQIGKALGLSELNLLDWIIGLAACGGMGAVMAVSKTLIEAIMGMEVKE